MPYHDDTDRFCPLCGGKRYLIDGSRVDYGYSARSTTTCWACVRPSADEPAQLGPDALIDAAMARLAAAAGMSVPDFRQEQWNSMHGEDA